MDMNDERAILKARARALAREADRAPGAHESLEIVEFRLASETYGLETRFVREIQPLKDLTPLPGVPPFVLGLANVRGQILSILDLKIFLNLPAKGLGELNKMIIVRNDRLEFGILADVILGTRTVPLDAVHAPPSTVTGIGAKYLRGVTGEGLIILDADKILGDETIIVHQDADESTFSKGELP
jgi:purine-binding chemotaxis protein CheW